MPRSGGKSTYPTVGFSRTTSAYQHIGTLIEKGIRKAIGQLPKPTTPDAPEMPDMPFDSLFGAIGALTRELNRVPKDSVDLAPVQDGIAAVHQAIANLPEAPEQVDLTPVTDALEGISSSLDALQADIANFQEEQSQALMAQVKADIEEVGKTLEKKLIATIEAQEFSFPVQRTVNKPQPAEQQPLDVSHIM